MGGRTMSGRVGLCLLGLVLTILGLAGATADEVSSVPAPPPAIEPRVRSVDLAVSESADVTLCDGATVRVKLVELRETRDALRDAVRSARVRVEIDGQEAEIESANYNLPRVVGHVRVDCPITRGTTTNSKSDAWGLVKDARLRLWPAEGPLLEPGTFVYPVRQRWAAGPTQMANEPCYVDACDNPKVKRIYYHYGLDFGGAEKLVEVVAATDGLVVSAGEDRLPGYDDSPVKPRYDVVYLLDGRGWFYRYSHFASIDPSIRPGLRVTAGRRLGLLGKEGGSGGWSHLHFDIFCRQPSGKWGCQEAYAFVWEAYLNEHAPKLVAVARPHHLVRTGDEVVLDASKSWSAAGEKLRFEWTMTDGSRAEGSRVARRYDQPGYYSETVRVIDESGREDYDFAIVVVIDGNQPERMVPTIHPAFFPTEGIRPGQPITFKVRTFGTTHGEETWDFGDGSAPQTTRSDGNVDHHAIDGYAVVRHAYEKPGHYVVRVGRTDEHGRPALGALHVVVESP